jgi:hypothetical protein
LRDAAAARLVRVAGGAEHSLALSDDGALFAWGAKDNGRLGHGKSAWWCVPARGAVVWCTVRGAEWVELLAAAIGYSTAMRSRGS